MFTNAEFWSFPQADGFRHSLTVRGVPAPPPDYITDTAAARARIRLGLSSVLVTTWADDAGGFVVEATTFSPGAKLSASACAVLEGSLAEALALCAMAPVGSAAATVMPIQPPPDAQGSR